ncbi:MAG TPA: EAL domain-containing protein [Acetobacteraceae bacterium]|nr:EAL domain-containing protein [Acetobacteraceae bacterium]
MKNGLQVHGESRSASDLLEGQADRRRPGRMRYVNPALIPLLRGQHGTVAPDAAEEPTEGRTPCGACRNAPALFPFSVAFQPIVDVEAGRIDAYEALVRGPAAEGAGFVLDQVTPEQLYAFDQACRVKAIEMAAKLGIDRRLNVNFLPNAVYEPRACIQTTLRTARRTGFPLDRLTFEIVESEHISETNHLRDIIAEYRRHGFQVALDDFGTGYSGLARLAELRPDVIKLDRILVQGCDTDRTRMAVIAAMLRMAQEIGVKVVVEGVERAEEVTALRAAGARFMQGFFWARPTFERILRDADLPGVPAP